MLNVMPLRHWQRAVLTLSCVLISSLAFAKPTHKTVEWIDLLPKSDLEALSNPPEYLNDIQDGSLEDQIDSQLGNSLKPKSNSAYDRALVSTQIRPEFDQQKIRIAGFIVPLEFNDEQVVTEFFLVPFFGACIHVPPPPPNQIIFAKMKKGVKIDDIFLPFWIEGTMSTKTMKNEMATAAYQISVETVKEYKE